MRKLIVIVSLISYNCAATNKVANPTILKQDIPLMQQSSEGAQEIDPLNPPTNGVWMTWEDAYSLAKFQREQRISLNNKILDAEKDKEICGIKLQKTEKALQEQDSSVKKWFNTWGFPIGIIVGGILGATLPIALGAHK